MDAMLTLPDYTSYDEIRAVLGVSDEEIEDTTLALPIYAQKLEFEMEEISVNLQGFYTTALAAVPPTAAQTKLLNTVQVFSAYAIAKHLLGSASLFAPRRIGDGRAETERVTDPFEALRQHVEAGYQYMKQKVIAALEGLGEQVGAATSRTYAASAGLPVDNVTG
jgi:hypothetical protein